MKFLRVNFFKSIKWDKDGNNWNGEIYESLAFANMEDLTIYIESHGYEVEGSFVLNGSHQNIYLLKGKKKHIACVNPVETMIDVKIHKLVEMPVNTR